MSNYRKTNNTRAIIEQTIGGIYLWNRNRSFICQTSWLEEEEEEEEEEEDEEELDDN
jgi:hypothetical protein